MAKTDIELRGAAYSIACAPGQEARIQALGEQLNDRVTKISKAVGEIGDDRVLMIAALALLDELDAARRATPTDPELEQKTAAALDNAAARIEALAERITSGE